MYTVMNPETENPQEVKGVHPGKPAHKLIWVDDLRRVHNVGFLAGRLIFLSLQCFYPIVCSD